MPLAQDNKMINAFTADRSDSPFYDRVLPRSGERDRLVPDAHGVQALFDQGAADAAAVADEIAWSLLAWSRFCNLTPNSFCCRMLCGADPDKHTVSR
jgi:hypothetical protein